MRITIFFKAVDVLCLTKSWTKWSACVFKTVGFMAPSDVIILFLSNKTCMLIVFELYESYTFFCGCGDDLRVVIHHRA